MLELEHFFLRYGSLPRVEGRLRVVWMHGLGPAVILILLLRLAGKVFPPGLLAFHHPLGVVRPDEAAHRCHRGAEAFFARPQRVLDVFGLGNIARDL